MGETAYEAIRQVIDMGGYNLHDMLLRIDILWMEHSLDATERDALKAYAREHAVPENSYATPEQRILALEIALRDLEARVATLESSGDEEQTDEQTQVSEWKQPTGAHDAYNTGDRVTFNGQVYESLINGNVWSPADYPAGWQEITSN